MKTPILLIKGWTRRNALICTLIATVLLLGLLPLPSEVFRLLLGSLLTATLFRGALALLPKTAGDQQWSYRLKVVNNSNFAIHKLFVSASAEDDCGPDQLGLNVLEANGDSFTLNGITPGRYNLRVVDEGGDSCLIRGVRINGNTTWNVCNSRLQRVARSARLSGKAIITTS